MADWEEKPRFITNFIKVVIKGKYKYNDTKEWNDEIGIRIGTMKTNLNNDSQKYTAWEN